MAMEGSESSDPRMADRMKELVRQAGITGARANYWYNEKYLSEKAFATPGILSDRQCGYCFEEIPSSLHFPNQSEVSIPLLQTVKVDDFMKGFHDAFKRISVGLHDLTNVTTDTAITRPSEYLKGSLIALVNEIEGYMTSAKIEPVTTSNYSDTDVLEKLTKGGKDASTYDVAGFILHRDLNTTVNYFVQALKYYFKQDQ